MCHTEDSRRMLKKAVQQDRSEVRDAKNNEVHDVQNNARQVCERARSVSAQCLKLVRAGEPVSRQRLEGEA